MSFLDPASQRPDNFESPPFNRLRNEDEALSDQLHWLRRMERAAININSETALLSWIQDVVGKFIPHEAAVTGIAQITLDSWRIDRIAGKAPVHAGLTTFKPWDAQTHSPLFAGWISSRMAQCMDASAMSAAPQIRWRRAAMDNGFDNVAMCGIETGCSGRFVFLKLFNVQIPLDEASSRLYLTMPTVLDAWSRLQTVEDAFREPHFSGSQMVQPNVPIDATSATRSLTKVEWEVFNWLVKGKTPAEIAGILRKSRQTVRHQAASIY